MSLDIYEHELFLVTACHLFNETSTTGSLLPHVRLHEV